MRRASMPTAIAQVAGCRREEPADALTEDAVERGAFGSPTFFVNDEMFFGKDQLRDVEEEILAQAAVRAETCRSVRQARAS